jgi:uncharacterized protein
VPESVTQPVDPAATGGPSRESEAEADGSAPEAEKEGADSRPTDRPGADGPGADGPGADGPGPDGPERGEDPPRGGPAAAATTTSPPATGDATTGPRTVPTQSVVSTADFRTAVVSTVTVDLPNQHATVVLRENESPRRHLSFAIGIPDAVTLSHALRRITTPRPLTHELMTEVLETAEVDTVAVRIVGRKGTVYFAELDVRSRVGRGVHACRPSDGLTLALLQKVPVPILVDRRLFDEAGDVEPA